MQNSFSKDQCQNCNARNRSSFAKLLVDDLCEIDRQRSLIHFSTGDELPSKLNGHDGFYCVRNGHLKVNIITSKYNRTTRICGPGDLLHYGEWWNPQRQNVIAIGNGEACFFKRTDFLTFQAQSATLANGLIEMLCKILSIKSKRIVALENHSVQNRVAALLLGLIEKFGVKSGTHFDLLVTIDRPSLANLAGTVPETFARVLTTFEANGVIRRMGRKLKIINKEALQKAAES